MLTLDRIGYQIIFAAGLGMSLEQCNIAVQTVLRDDQIPAGTSLVILARSLGGVIGSAIGQAVFQDGLAKALRGVIAGGDVKSIGAPEILPLLREKIGGDAVAFADALRKVNNSVTNTFMAALIMGCLTLPCALLVEWRSVKQAKKAKETGETDASKIEAEKISEKSTTDLSGKV
jgi:ABC-type Fe3+ transport system permease subunit